MENSTQLRWNDASYLNGEEMYRYCDICPCSAIKVVGLAPDQALAYDGNPGIGPITACADLCMLPEIRENIVLILHVL